MTPIKALTVCQPYAHLIAILEKPIENRTWPTSYRGPLLIHAGRSRAWLDEDDEVRYPKMDYGAIVAVADLVACLHLDSGEPWPEQWASLRGNRHALGPWCWVLEHVRRLTAPVECMGHQGLWLPDAFIVAAVQKQIGVTA